MLKFEIEVCKGFIMIMGMLTGKKDDQNKLFDDKWSDGTLIGLQPHIMTSLTKKGHKKGASGKIAIQYTTISKF